ncbi:lipocalin family protein [Thalassorhabdomicrobium marinisediminis]|uniref:lipocalin family protein n=1 Tax=Thalassorhabdomicrobium marinisediminis TaxID=2170577 RepID=UPI00249182D2|nr:lipocalin family protein [Thalassorhabdomicrobium marinisediminis]
MVLGCTATPPSAPISYRDQAAQIASQTDVTAERLAGNWVVRQGYSQGGPIDSLSFEAEPDGALRMRSCAGDTCSDPAARLAMTGPGRWTPQAGQAAPVPAPLWVLWMDFDSRTAAVGTPDGRFGWIMDRAPTGGADRIAAAREIMDWFGYDMARLADLP